MHVKISYANDGSRTELLPSIEEGADTAQYEESLFDEMAITATASGLVFSRPTAYGAEWEGTEAQITDAVHSLPAWAEAEIIE